MVSDPLTSYQHEGISSESDIYLQGFQKFPTGFISACTLAITHLTSKMKPYLFRKVQKPSSKHRGAQIRPKWICTTVADLRGGGRQGRAPPPLGQNFFIFHAVFGKNSANSRLAPPLRVGEILDPPLHQVPFFHEQDFRVFSTTLQ